MKYLKTFENIFDELPIEIAPDNIEKYQQYKATVINPDFHDEDPYFKFFVLNKNDTSIDILVIDDDTDVEHIKKLVQKHGLQNLDMFYDEEDIITWYIKNNKIYTAFGHLIAFVY